MSKPAGYWNYENCYLEAKKYSTRTELHDKNILVYKIACKNKWINDYTWFVSKNKPRGYWNNYDRCYNEAKKYKCRSEFFQKSSTAYHWANKNEWLDDYDWFDGGRVKRGTWTYENCLTTAKKCNSRVEFATNYAGAYDAAITNGWINDWDWLKRTVHERWTYEDCLEESKKYKSRSDFASGNGSAYSASIKNGWIDNFDLKDERLDLINGKIDLVYAYEFAEQHAVYIGRTLIRRVKHRDKEHVFSETDAVHMFAKENNVPVPEMEILEDNLTIKEGSENEGIWLELYKEDGWKILNRAKTGGLGSIGTKYSKYTYDACYEIAKAYSTRNDFKKGCVSAYNVALKNKWLNDYDWFVSKTKPRNYWNNYDNCYEVAKNCSSRIDFKKISVQAYRVALHNGWIYDYKWFEKPVSPKLKWDYDACLNESKKYTYIGQFASNAPVAYRNAKKHGWIDNYTWLERKRKKRNTVQLSLFENDELNKASLTY